MSNYEIKLGDKVRDKVTGFEGIATSRTEFMNGCVQIEVTSKLKKGERPKIDDMSGVGIDIEQLEVIGNGLNTPKKEIKKSNTGGPMRMVAKKLY